MNIALYFRYREISQVAVWPSATPVIVPHAGDNVTVSGADRKVRAVTYHYLWDKGVISELRITIDCE